MKRVCLQEGCGRLTPETYCDEHRRARRREYERWRPTPAQRGYNEQWRKVRAQVLDRDHWTCAYCGAVATAVDHIVPPSKGGPMYDPDNLRAACKPCNSRKSDR